VAVEVGQYARVRILEVLLLRGCSTITGVLSRRAYRSHSFSMKYCNSGIVTRHERAMTCGGVGPNIGFIGTGHH
jgi:hypothetical protein